MAKVMGMSGTPKDRDAFDSYCFDRHVPLAKTVPGLRDYEVTRGDVVAIDGASPCYLIATLTFDSLAAIHATLASAEGKAIAANLANVATGGAQLCFAGTASV